MNGMQMAVVGIAVVIVVAGAAALLIFTRPAEDEGLVVMTSFYPLAYFAEEIGGDKVTVKTLIPPGSEVHTWQPSTADILAADKADILVYNGAGLEPWFESDILGAITKEGKEIVNTTHDLDLFENDESKLEHLLHEADDILHEWEDGDMTAEEAMEAIEELIHRYAEQEHDQLDHDHDDEHTIEEIEHIIHGWKDGNMTAEEAMEAMEELIHEYKEHAHEHDHDHGLYDPHTWVDPVLAKQQARAIYNALKRADPSNTEHYTARWNVLAQRFDDIHTLYEDELKSREHSVIFVTHDAYGYITRRYGLEQHTVIGLHADEEPGVAALQTIADEMVEHGVYTFFVQPLYPDKYAETIKTEVEKITGTSVTIRTLYHMSNTVEGLDYFQQMEANLDNLKVGLGA